MISAGRIGFKAQFQLQWRPFLVPWFDPKPVTVVKKNVITCLKKRDSSSSSVPVQYIPKKSNYQSNKLESSDSEPVKISKRKDFSEFSEPRPPLSNELGYGCDALLDNRDNSMEESKNVSEELSVHRQRSFFSEDESKNGDEKFATSQDPNVARKSFDLDMRPRNQTQVYSSNLLHDVIQDSTMEEPSEDSDNDGILEEREDELSEEDNAMEELGEKLSIHQQNRSDVHDTYEVEKAAVRLLATRAFTTVELRKKLCGKKFAPSIVEAVVNDFKTRGLLNDGWYAEAFCQSKWSSSTWGPRRIKQQLSFKGVSKLDSEKAIRLVFEDGKSDDHETSCHGLSKTSMDRLLIQASKQWARSSEVPKEKRKARIIRWLQYRGFTWSVIGFIVNKLESDHRS